MTEAEFAECCQNEGWAATGHDRPADQPRTWDYTQAGSAMFVEYWWRRTILTATRPSQTAATTSPMTAGTDQKSVLD